MMDFSLIALKVFEHIYIWWPAAVVEALLGRCEIGVSMKVEVRAAISFISLPRVIKCLRATFINVSRAPAEGRASELILYVKQRSIQFYGFAHSGLSSGLVDVSRPAGARRPSEGASCSQRLSTFRLFHGGIPREHNGSVHQKKTLKKTTAVVSPHKIKNLKRN